MKTFITFFCWTAAYVLLSPFLGIFLAGMGYYIAMNFSRFLGTCIACLSYLFVPGIWIFNALF